MKVGLIDAEFKARAGDVLEKKLFWDFLMAFEVPRVMPPPPTAGFERISQGRLVR
jgi:hypothetical protein